MTKKAGARFSYIKPRDENDNPKQQESSTAVAEEGLTTVPKGEGRMEQDRTQLNIRVPTLLKRRAGAKATLEGRTLGEVVEEFLRTYVAEMQ